MSVVNDESKRQQGTALPCFLVPFLFYFDDIWVSGAVMFAVAKIFTNLVLTDPAAIRTRSTMGRWGRRIKKHQLVWTESLRISMGPDDSWTPRCVCMHNDFTHTDRHTNSPPYAQDTILSIEVTYCWMEKMHFLEYSKMHIIRTMHGI